MSFWQSGSGKQITGNEQDAFMQDYTTIPDNTIADAYIKSFNLIDRINEYSRNQEKFYEIIWRITSDDFKGRQVRQKISCFSGKVEAIDRNLNMLKLIFNLFNFTWNQPHAPNDQDLMPLINKMATIKIGEWEFVPEDGSKVLNGNNIKEVYASGSLKPEIGIPKTITESDIKKPPRSALNRNAQNKLVDDLDDDIPF